MELYRFVVFVIVIAGVHSLDLSAMFDMKNLFQLSVSLTNTL